MHQKLANNLTANIEIYLPRNNKIFKKVLYGHIFLNN